MNVLFEIINSLNKEESRFYKLFAGRTNSGDERKDIQLFDYIKEFGENYNEKEIAKELYGENKNSFYQLKNRLYKDLNKSMMLQHMSKEKDIFILHFVLLARVYKRKGSVELAFHFLKKAEKDADNLEAFELLSVIYSEILKLSYDYISIDVEAYIEKKRKNHDKLNWVQEIDMLLAAVMYRIKTAQNFSSKGESVTAILQETLDNFNNNDDIPKSPKFRIKIYLLISRILLQQHNFAELEDYLTQIFSDFKRDKIFNRTNHEHKLMMLTYLTNCTFKTHKHKDSLKYAELLKTAMNEFDGFLKDKYLFYYYNALIINYSVSDKLKALKILDEARNNDVIQGLPTFSVFIYLNTALINYDLGETSIAGKNISRLILQDDFIQIGKSFQLKIRIADLIIRYKLKQTDLVDEKINLIKKEYKTILKDNSFSRDKEFIAILEKLIVTHNFKAKKDLVNRITNLSDIITNEKADDADVINYNIFLKELF